MTQGERSRTIKKLLKWLDESDEKGVTIAGIAAYVTREITEMGATERTAKSYVHSLEDANLIECRDGFRFTITKAGKNWLRRHYK